MISIQRILFINQRLHKGLGIVLSTSTEPKFQDVPLPRTSPNNTASTPASPSSQLEPPRLPLSPTSPITHYVGATRLDVHNPAMSSAPSLAELQAYSEKLQALYKKLPNLLDLPDAKDSDTAALEQDVKNLNVKEHTLQDKVDAYCQEFLNIGGPVPPRHRQLEKQVNTSA
jgi:hypothetical protein